ncbi:polysaccharide biosynthesis tyrosine autokinase [Brachybacterium aquaticum]|uniref:Capsular exopolysaccharide synthesis family protein n=1 Tax=Brachybacterium aquaticum TaxID=1432564 RepID=A0A841AHM3_9MICO|nr:polysaccharide biosynthesis tyrosine autokinase [Brachybacterium aquaticum]MBB5832762.1 capsular exopolysaccharide synthesis family protein [Brachybacterium aquaticum]
MTIEDFLRMMLRNALVLLVLTIVGAVAGLGLSFTRSPVYAASALGYVSANTSTDESGSPVAQSGGNMELQYSKAQSYLPLFRTRAVGERVVEDLGLQQSPDSIAGSLQATVDPNAPIITVTAYAGSAEDASAIANSAVEATAAEALELETGADGRGTPSVQLVPYQTALVPGGPASPDRSRFLLAGAALGLLLGLGLGWLRSRNDSRLRTPEDITALVGVPVLGSLPDVKDFTRTKDGALPEPESFAARESMRKLRTNLRFVDVDSPPRSIVVTSSTAAEGKSTVAANLARVMARAGQPTLLIDADLRRPTVAAAFGVDGKVGLSQLLAKSISVEDALQLSGTRGLTVLPAGHIPPNPSELLGSRSMHELVEEFSRSYFVIIDAPPLLAVTDAQLLSRQVDGALVVAVSGRSRSDELLRGVEAVRSIGGTVYGVVMNRVPSSRLTRIAYGASAEYGGYGKAYDKAANIPEMDEIEIAAIDGREVESSAPSHLDSGQARTTSTPVARTSGRRRADVEPDS